MKDRLLFELTSCHVDNLDDTIITMIRKESARAEKKKHQECTDWDCYFMALNAFINCKRRLSSPDSIPSEKKKQQLQSLCEASMKTIKELRNRINFVMMVNCEHFFVPCGEVDKKTGTFPYCVCLKCGLNSKYYFYENLEPTCDDKEKLMPKVWQESLFRVISSLENEELKTEILHNLFLADLTPEESDRYFKYYMELVKQEQTKGINGLSSEDSGRAVH